MGLDPNDPLLKKLKTAKGESLFDAYHKDLLNSPNREIISPSPEGEKSTGGLHLHEKSESTSKKGSKSHFRNNIIKTPDGTFHSEWEHVCFLQLRDMVRRKIISDLDTQIKFSMDHKGIHICDSILDFSFVYKGEKIYADAKSRFVAQAQRWRWQQAMLHAFHDIKRVLVFYKGESNCEKRLLEFTS